MSLWRNGSFVRLWLAQVVSNAGSQITNLALPRARRRLLLPNQAAPLFGWRRLAQRSSRANSQASSAAKISLETTVA